MIKKLSNLDLIGMISREIADHIEEITQTEICTDKKYCKHLLELYRMIPLSDIDETELVNEEFLTEKA